MNPNYTRVVPRDLFNEAKLLKCMGHLVLKILDRKTPVEMTNSENGKAFKVVQFEEDGGLAIANLDIKIKGKSFIFKTVYNSKHNYPLLLYYEWCEYPVFDDKGEFTDEFIEFCNNVK